MRIGYLHDSKDASPTSLAEFHEFCNLPKTNGPQHGSFSNSPRCRHNLPCVDSWAFEFGDPRRSSGLSGKHDTGPTKSYLNGLVALFGPMGNSEGCLAFPGPHKKSPLAVPFEHKPRSPPGNAPKQIFDKSKWPAQAAPKFSKEASLCPVGQTPPPNRQTAGQGTSRNPPNRSRKAHSKKSQVKQVHST